MNSRKKIDSPAILSIEDNLIVQNIYQSLCRSLGVNLILASSGQSGIQQALNYHQSIRFILLDIGLPDINGFQVAKELKRVGVLSPIVVVSAQHFSQEKQKEYVGIIDGFYQKALTIETLRSLIKKYFSPKELKKIVVSKEKKTRRAAFREA